LAQTVSLAFCFDERFGAYASVAIASALANADAFYKIYCLYSGDPAKFPREIEVLANRYRCEIVKVDVPQGVFDGWKIDGGSNLSVATYFRLLIPQAVPEARVIYLDCDLIVTCGLSDLYNHDLQGKWLGGCQDPNGKATSRLNLPDEEPYLNGGVLLIDVEAFRENLPLDFVRKSYHEHLPQITWHDQCLLNRMCQGKKAVLPSSWNLQMHLLSREAVEEQVPAQEGSAVIHFSGPAKPWMEWSPSCSTELWSKYARLAGLTPDAVMVRPADVLQKMFVAAKHEAERNWTSATDAWREVAFILVDQIKAMSPAESA
jgi:lipopolysaccharide biosynthesis glycosyltransferase